MKALSLLLLAPFVHASGRLEATTNLAFYQGDVAAPRVKPHSGLISCANGSLKWVWPSGLKLGFSGYYPFGLPSHVRSSSSTVSRPLPGPFSTRQPNGYTEVFQVAVPSAELLECNFPLRNSDSFKINASLGVGRAKWSATPTYGYVVSSPNAVNVAVGHFAAECTFAWSALLNMEWEFCSHFALRAFGGYMSLGKVNFAGNEGYKSDVGGITFGLGLGLK